MCNNSPSFIFTSRLICEIVGQGYVEALIQRYYLNEPEKIEVYRPRKVLRITSTREKSAFIVSEIENGVRSIIRKKIQLKELYNEHLVRGWEARDITPSVLAKLGELTKTEIRRLHIPEPIVSSLHCHFYFMLLTSCSLRFLPWSQTENQKWHKGPTLQSAYCWI